MSSFPILDLLLGLVFIFFILSIITSSVVEVIMTKMNYRSRILTRWLRTIFDKEMLQADGSRTKLGVAIANHCLTTALSKNGTATSFIDAKNFVSALIEKVTFDPENPKAPVPESLKDLLEKLNSATALDGTFLLSTELRRTIQLFGSEAKMLAPAQVNIQTGEGTDPQPPNSFQIFREKLEAWFDSSMDRITGRLKKQYARPLTFWIGLIVVVSLNADAIDISRYLYDHKQEAKVLADRVQLSAAGLNQIKDSAAIKRIEAALDTLNNAVPKGLPLGWEAEGTNIKDAGSAIKAAAGHLPGWLASVMAIMLGAPFWFDLLNKISNIRGAGNKPPSVTEKQREKTGTS